MLEIEGVKAMKNRLVLSALVAGGFFGALNAEAQDLRSPEVALDHLRQGYISRASLFTFDGCPQTDATGRAVFEAVRDHDVDGHTLVQLARAFAWEGAYPDCNYEPLNEWMVQAFTRLHRAGEIGPATSFARRVSPRIHKKLSEAFIDAAADESFGGDGPRGVAATAAVFKLDDGDQLEAALSAFEHDAPRAWIAHASRRLARAKGAQFFREVAGAADMSDQTMFTIADVIRADIVDGIIEPDSDGLDLIREEVDSRPDVPLSARIPTRGSRR